jgi:putative ABC transport system permease protein
LQDIRYAGRRLRANIGFAVVTVLALGVGIGASAAIFGAVNPILFEPLPYPNASRIAMIVETGKDRTRNSGTFGMYRGLLERNRSFEAIAVIKPWQPTMTGADQPERFDGQRISASYFQGNYNENYTEVRRTQASSWVACLLLEISESFPKALVLSLGLQ